MASLLEIVLQLLITVPFLQSFIEVPLTDQYPLSSQYFMFIKLPTRYQCIELCVTFKLCRSLTFDDSSGFCVLNSDDEDRQNNWDTGYNHFTIKSKEKIPEDIGSACKVDSCAIDETCVRSGLTYFCVRHDYSTVKCPPSWGHVGDICFMLFLESKTWTEAKDYCASTGAELVMLNNQNEPYHKRWIHFQLQESRNRPKLGKVWTALQNTPDVRSWLGISGAATNGSNLCLGLNYNETSTPAYPVTMGAWEAVSCNEKHVFACQHRSPDQWD